MAEISVWRAVAEINGTSSYGPQLRRVGVTANDFPRTPWQGRKEDRFVAFTLATYTDAMFRMFRRSKLLVGELPPDAEKATVEGDLRRQRHAEMCAAEA